MAYGSPSRPEDIPAYFADIRGGRPVRPEAIAELTERYRRIGGASPLNAITERQRVALEADLGVPVYVGMKHWTPWIREAAGAALDGGAQRILGLVLAPHYSSISIGGYRERLEEAIADRAELVMVDSWHDHAPYIAILADRIRSLGLTIRPGEDVHALWEAISPRPRNPPG